MRKVFLAVACAVPAAFVTADEPKKPDAPAPAKIPAAKINPAPRPVQPKKEATLKVGDPAPKFSADKWLQGQEVANFESGKMYVVEFWATWCGPCIVMMPHLSELQKEYREKGVTFIGYSAKDPNNTEEKVTEFVKKRGPKLGYTFAYADNRDVYGNWMTAAGQNGIPCCFVVDAQGKLAYIGHPMYLDYVLPKVVAKTWTEADLKNLEDVKKEVSGMFSAAQKEPEEYIKQFDALAAKHPWVKNVPYFTSTRISKLVGAKKFDDACVVVKNLMAKATANEDTSMLRQLSSLGTLPGVKDNAEMMALTVKAAEANLKVSGENDFAALMGAMSTYTTAGDKEKSGAYTAKAIAAAKTASDSAMLLRLPVVKENKETLGKILANAEKQLGTEKGVSYSIYYAVAEGFFANGDKAKAKTYGEKAVAAAPQQIKAQIERAVAKYGDNKNDN